VAPPKVTRRRIVKDGKDGFVRSSRPFKLKFKNCIAQSSVLEALKGNADGVFATPRLLA